MSADVKIQVRHVTLEDAIKGLSDIHADVQSKFHDKWDHMRAGFLVDVIQHYQEDHARLVSAVRVLIEADSVQARDGAMLRLVQLMKQEEAI